MTTKIQPDLKVVDPLDGRPRWQRDGEDGLLPKLPTIRWQRLDDLREQHVALVADLRTVVEVDDQAAEEKILDQLGDLVLAELPRLWEHFPGEGEDAFRLAAEAVTPKAAPADGSAPIEPRPASVEGSGDLVDVVNAHAETTDEAYRREVAKLADARAAFDRETATWRGLWRRLEPVFLVRNGAVSVDVREVEKHRGVQTEEVL